MEDEATRSIAAATQASRPNTGAATVLTLNDDASAVSGVTTGSVAPVKSEEVNMGYFIPVPLKKDGQ